MRRPPNNHVEALLASDQGRAWLARVVADYHVREAKDAVRAEIRASVADTAAADGVFQELCRRASVLCKSAVPTPELPGGPTLGDRITTCYPYPIAVAYRAFREAEGPAAEFGCLITLFESLVHYLAAVAVSAYLRTDLPSAACNRHLAETFLRGKWSTGTIYSLMRDTLAHAGDCGGELPYGALLRHLFTDAGKPTPQARELEAFIELRNSDWGHGGNRTDDYFAPLVAANWPRLERQLALMPWLGELTLIRPVAIDGGAVVLADLLRGASRYKRQPFALPLAPRDLDPATGEVRADRSTLLLVRPDGGRYLPLFPLAQFRIDRQGAYLLTGMDWSSGRPPVALRKAVYVAYQAKAPRHEEPPRDLAAHSLERGVTRLLERSPAAVESKPAAAAQEADPDFLLPEVAVEQQSHLKWFVGRAGLLDEITGWVDATAEGGYLLLLGPPGEGKSALMAELARREAGRGGCLLHMVKSHSSPLRFVPALIGQAARLAGTPFGAEAYRGGVDDLRNSLLRALEAVRERTGRAVLVIDALDELEAGGERVAFLPPRLPAGVRAVLTCRPDIPLTEALRARLRGGLAERPVLPLTPEDFRLLLASRLEARVTGRAAEALGGVDVGRLFRQMGGNALFLNVFVEDVTTRWSGGPLPIGDGDVPGSLAAVFRTVYGRVRGTPPTPEGRQRARLLHLMSVAREALPIEALCGLMRAWGETLYLDDCRDRVEEMSQWLLEAPAGRFKPWHQGLADHVRANALGDAGVREVEGIFCRWLEGSEGGEYGLRHTVRHLLAAGEAMRAFAAMTDLLGLEGRVRAGLAFEMLADMAEVGRGLPDGEERWLLSLLEEAVRRDIHFIDRHKEDYPQALFQCAWNNGWWYDCEEAARHYDLAGRSSETPPPWAREGEKLSALLERWREGREKREPSFPWLRAHRPPATGIGTPLRAVLRGHGAAVRGVAFSPDGAHIISGSADGTARIWDARSGEEAACLRGHAKAVSSVAFSPQGDRAVTGSLDWTVRVWDVAGGAELACLRGHGDRVADIGFSPCGGKVACGSWDRTARVWDVTSGAELACLRGHEAGLNSVHFTPDGSKVVTASSDRTVRVWDAGTGAEVRCLRGHTSVVVAAGVSPDGGHIASASMDGTVRIWDASTGECRLVLPNEEKGLAGLSFSPDGARIAVGGWDRAIRIWCARTGGLLACLRGHEDRVRCVAFGPDGRLASGADDHSVRVWEPGGREEPLPLRGHGRKVNSVGLSSSGDRAVTAGADGTARIWDLKTGVELAVLRGHGKAVYSAQLSPDGERIVTGSEDKTVIVWGPGEGTQLRLEGHGRPVSDAAFSPDGTRVVSGSLDGTVRVWDAVSGADLLCIQAHETGVLGVEYADGGEAIVSTGWGPVESIWDATTGERREAVATTVWASGPMLIPRRGTLETAFHLGGRAVAWLPGRHDHFRVVAGEWGVACAEASHFAVSTLEGAGGQGGRDLGVADTPADDGRALGSADRTSSIPSECTLVLRRPASRSELPTPYSSLVRAEFGAASHAGKVRPHNEDAYLVHRTGRSWEPVFSNLPEGQLPERFDESGYLMAVADGMGGNTDGEAASHWALRAAVAVTLNDPQWALKLDHPTSRVREVELAVERSHAFFRAIHQAITERTQSDPSLAKMGTTLAATYSFGRDLFVMHAGDSRVYLWRMGELRQLTRDHTITQEMIDAGTLAPEEAAGHRMSHVLTRALGCEADEIDASVEYFDLSDGDVLLLCTKGLTNMVSDRDIASVLDKGLPAESACEALVQMALDAGGKHNVTAVIGKYRLPS